MNPRSDQEQTAVRILVAESRPEVRSALRLLIEQDEVMVVTTEAAKVEELLRQVRIACPDVVLLDCDLPGIRVSEVMPQLRSICPAVQVVALCTRPEMRGAVLSAGADAFVCKTEPPERLLAILQSSIGPGGPSTGGRSCGGKS